MYNEHLGIYYVTVLMLIFLPTMSDMYMDYGLGLTGGVV